MLARNMDREAIRRHPLSAKPAECFAGPNVDALHVDSMRESLPHVKRERVSDASCELVLTS